VSSTYGTATDSEPRQQPEPSLLSAVYRAIDAIGGAWLVLRGGEDSLDRGGDVDILVDPGMFDQVRNALHANGFASVPSAGQGSHRFFLGYDEQNQRWARLDFVTRIDFGVHQELTTDVAPDLLRGRSRIDDYFRLADDDAFWYLFLHRYLTERDLKPLELALLALRASPAGVFAELVDRLGVPGASSAELLDLARRRQWPALEAQRADFQRAWRRKLPGSLLTRGQHGVDRARHAVASLRRPTGLSITIIGPDGAGKTTLADGLRATLPFPSRYVYMGVWRAYPQDRYLRFVPGARLAQRMGRLLFRSAQAWFHRTRGRIVLLDRFTYDVLLPSADLDYRGRVTAWLVRRICAEPQLVVVLNAPAEVMWARKGEQGVEELERRRLTYLEIARTRADSVVLDARKPVDDVRATAERAVWERLRRHWNRRG
jgi:thymidylate kinase